MTVKLTQARDYCQYRTAVRAKLLQGGGRKASARCWCQRALIVSCSGHRTVGLCSEPIIHDQGQDPGGYTRNDSLDSMSKRQDDVHNGKKGDSQMITASHFIVTAEQLFKYSGGRFSQLSLIVRENGFYCFRQGKKKRWSAVKRQLLTVASNDEVIA